MQHLISLIVLCAACAGANAQVAKIVKCTVDGKVTYTSEPCLNDADAAPAPPPPPQAAAQSTPELERELAHQQATLHELETARLAREAKDDKASTKIDSVDLTQKQKCDKLRLRKKLADQDVVAASPATAPALRKKARHAAEAVASECPA